MKVVQVTKHFIYQNTLFSVEQAIDEYSRYLEQWQKKISNKATIEQLNNLYFNN